MTTTPTQSPPQAPTSAPRLARAGALRGAYWAAVLGLIALNAWWAWDARPLVPLKELDRWVASERDVDARSAPWWEFWRAPHNNASAIAELRRAVRHSPHDAEALMMLGRALGAAKQYRGAAEAMGRVPEWSPRKTQALHAEGLAWLILHRARNAEAALLGSLRRDPNHPTYQLAAGPAQISRDKLLDLYALEDRWDEARALIWQAYDDAPGPTARRHFLEMALRTYLERSHPSATRENLGAILEADPGDWKARRALAVAMNAEKLHEEADRQIAVCLAEHPDDPRTWGDWLDMLRARDDFDAVEAAVAKAPPAADADPRVLMARGRVLRQERDHAAAAKCFAAAVTLAPADPDARNSLALALQLLGKPDEAKVHRERHAELEALITKEVPEAVNAYKDASEDPRVTPDALKAAILRLAAACRGMGWTREADGWTRAADEA